MSDKNSGKDRSDISVNQMRRELLQVARRIEETCLKLYTEIAQAKTQGEEAARAQEREREQSEAARNRIRTILQKADPGVRDEIFNAYLEASRVIYSVASAKERHKLLNGFMDSGGSHLDVLQSAVISLNDVARTLDLMAGSGQSSLSSSDGIKERELERIILMAQEDEKRRVSIVIHDGPAQLLANLIMRTDFCVRLIGKDPREAAAELTSLRKEMQVLFDDVRRLIFDLRPMTLDDLGFIPTLQRFVENLKTTIPFDVQLSIRGQVGPMDKLTEIVLYRVVQEAVKNVGKHAQAKRSWIRLKADAGAKKLILEVEDNGCGFDPSVLPDMVDLGRLGIHSMRKRVRLVDGEFSISSTPGKGTVVTVEVAMEPRQ